MEDGEIHSAGLNRPHSGAVGQADRDFAKAGKLRTTATGYLRRNVQALIIIAGCARKEEGFQAFELFIQWAFSVKKSVSSPDFRPLAIPQSSEIVNCFKFI